RQLHGEVARIDALHGAQQLQERIDGRSGGPACLGRGGAGAPTCGGAFIAHAKPPVQLRCRKGRNRFRKGSPWGTCDPCTRPSRTGRRRGWCKLREYPGERSMSENEKPVTQRGRMPLHWKMAIGFVAGLLLGLVAHYAGGAEAGWVDGLTTWVTQPVGTLFLRLIFMLVIPLLFSALVVGVAEMGDIRS